MLAPRIGEPSVLERFLHIHRPGIVDSGLSSSWAVRRAGRRHGLRASKPPRCHDTPVEPGFQLAIRELPGPVPGRCPRCRCDLGKIRTMRLAFPEQRTLESARHPFQVHQASIELHSKTAGRCARSIRSRACVPFSVVISGSTPKGEAHESTKIGLYFDRIAGGHRDHRGPDRPACCRRCRRPARRPDAPSASTTSSRSGSRSTTTTTPAARFPAGRLQPYLGYSNGKGGSAGEAASPCTCSSCLTWNRRTVATRSTSP